MGGKTSKAKGKHGERCAKDFLKRHGWLIADTETQGLAGDDVFARSPEGTWYSIEVKHVDAMQSKYLKQARKQSSERANRVKAMQHDPQSMCSLLAITHDARDWFVMWKPSGYDNGRDWIVFRGHGRRTRFEIWSDD